MNTAHGQSRRRWLRFRVRTLLVLVAVFSLPLGWIAYERRQIQLRAKAADAIEKLGGQFMALAIDDLPRTPWWQPLVGDDPLEGTVHLSFRRGQFKPIDDSAAPQLGQLTSLKLMDLSYSQISDETLSHLTGLRKLENLYLLNTRVTDAGVKKLQQALPNLHIER